MAAKKKAFAFEKSLSDLETLLQSMESGDLTLEKQLEYFEKGIRLTRDCQKALTDAEQKVQKLIEKDGKLALVKFSQGNDDNDD